MGKNVLVIGASGEIGKHIASRLASEGYQLILHYNKNRQTIFELMETIEESRILTVFQADLADGTELKAALQQLVYPVDCIVFASGTAHYGLFQETSEKVMDEMLNLHVKAPWLITKHFLPSMINKKYGKIIFISSIWGRVGASFEVVYSSVKGAQNSFVKALAKEVAPSGVSVNAVSPGFIETKMNQHLTEGEKASIYSEIPMNRPGYPSEVAHAVSFLLDERSSYIQGEIINIDGGW
ncbi:SDR family oxidoreductase [Oceanobacillus piezotolerans]|uniref:SDR family oxidoreductase n=1 Tax=Oceanobacillus piezotolerans TaxID=2448030 RepID=A0A498D6L2_9BACI|nr:SDR family oxidoreductase [Oceanobacillus piezotolerans]RLL45378.1 SDR family oxidoreductase [Oceanobacillus piezotolerans]